MEYSNRVCIVQLLVNPALFLLYLLLMCGLHSSQWAERAQVAAA